MLSLLGKKGEKFSSGLIPDQLILEILSLGGPYLIRVFSRKKISIKFISIHLQLVLAGSMVDLRVGELDGWMAWLGEWVGCMDGLTGRMDWLGGGLLG